MASREEAEAAGRSSVDFADKEDRDRYRHSASHVMAQAVLHLFPEAKLAIGPPIEDGFYYDFDVATPFTPEVIGRIEAEMAKIVAADDPFVHEEWSRQEAIEYFRHHDQPYKVELLEGIAEPTVSIYKQGDFVDLCRGPHLERTGQLKAFKLLNVAGAYWRGDEKNRMLQRIYGTAFPTQEQLDAYLKRLEEAKARDHRRLGKDLDLYSMHDEAGTGFIYWHPKGALIRLIIEELWWKEHLRRGYEPVYTPHLYRGDLLRVSGHLEKYADLLYNPMDIDGTDYYAKPMNCPGHILIYKNQGRSYRDLPMRYCELGTVYRYERSGVLHGMLRVRGFTQDDAHIFCTPEQFEDEIIGVLELVEFLMGTFHYTYRRFLATRPEQYLGSCEMWDMAEKGLRSALQRRGVHYEIDQGGGVFYGPKIDMKMIDALGREWQGPTVQLDFNLPERFDLVYTGPDGRQHRPVMIHRACLGSMERFVGGLIEHYGGAFPMWLAPVQVRVVPITDAHFAYANEVRDRLIAEGLRVEVDERNEKLSYKIRDAQVHKIPYCAVLGEREARSGTVNVRKYQSPAQEAMAVDAFAARLRKEVDSRELLVGGD